MNGPRFTHICKDEIELDGTPTGDARRYLVVEREDGSTYSADVPESFDLGEVIQPGDVVVVDTK